MIALKKILVATDFGPESDAAMRYGRELARGFGGSLHVLHVTENLFSRVMDAYSYAGLSPDVQAEIERASKKQTEELLSDEDRRELKAVAVTAISNKPAAGDRGLRTREWYRPDCRRNARSRPSRASDARQRRRARGADRAVSGVDRTAPGARVRRSRCPGSGGARLTGVTVTAIGHSSLARAQPGTLAPWTVSAFRLKAEASERTSARSSRRGTVAAAHERPVVAQRGRWRPSSRHRSLAAATSASRHPRAMANRVEREDFSSTAGEVRLCTTIRA